MSLIVKAIPALALTAVLGGPALAQKLGDKEEARIARAAPEDRDAVRYCLQKGDKGADKGTVIGAAGGAATGIIAGGSLGETTLAAGVGAAAGRLIGRGSGSNANCDEVLKRNK